MYTTATLCMALTPMLLLANASDIFDAKKVPSTCTNICQPISTLEKSCHVNDDRVGGKQNERTLEDSCICTNGSFDVAKVMPQCADCLSQAVGQGRKRDDGLESSDLAELNALVGRCGFRPASYTAADGEAAASIKVTAVPLMDISQIGTAYASPSGGSSQGTVPTNGGGSALSTGSGNGGVRPPPAATGTSSPSPVSGTAASNVVSAVGAAAVAAVWVAFMI